MRILYRKKVNFFLVLTIGCLLGFGKITGQTAPCYQEDGNLSGYNNVNSIELENLACDIVSTFENEGVEFSIFSRLHYSLNENFSHEYNLNERNEFFKAKNELATNNLAVSVEVNTQGSMYYCVNLKFPSEGIFNEITKLKVASIEKEIQQIMNEWSSATPEIALTRGLEKFRSILSKIKNGNYDPNVFEDNDFLTTNFVISSSIVRTSEDYLHVQVGDIEMYNFGKITENGDTLTNVLSDQQNISNLAQFHLSALIVFSSNDDISRFNEISAIFENSSKKFKLWVHLDYSFKDQNPTARDTDIGQRNEQVIPLHYKTLNNMSVAEKNAIIDAMNAPNISNWTADPGETEPSSADCSLNWKFGWNCILPSVESGISNNNQVMIGHLAISCGLLDGLLGTVEGFYNIVKGAGSVWNSLYTFVGNAIKDGIKIEAMLKDAYKAVQTGYNTLIEFYDDVKVILGQLYELAGDPAKLREIVDDISNHIACIFQDLWESGQVVKGLAYGGGLILFEVVAAWFSGGISTAAKGARFGEFVLLLKNNKVGAFIYDLVNSNVGKKFQCILKIKDGCFVKDTPILMVSNRSDFQSENRDTKSRFSERTVQSLAQLGDSFRNTIPAYAIAALPLVTPVPIQEVHLFDYAVAHNSVNASYGQTATANDTYLIGNDPYTSDQQRSRDQYEIDNENWNEVSFEEVNGTSTCKLALHNDWIEQNNYSVDAIVNMNLPEQGISGPFKITSIKHIIPQKKPVDEDESDEWEYRPVTGLFTHQSDAVHNITFSNNETLGVTAPHPIFSTTYNDWRLAGELEVGEKVLTYHGEATVLSNEKKAGSETVYNLEVKDLHNFLVGYAGVVVHNNYLQNLLKGVKGAKGLIGDAYEKWLYNLFPNSRKVTNKELGTWQAREYDIFFELGNKKILGEAKSGNALNYEDWVRKVRGDLGQQATDAINNGYEFYLFANKNVPDYVKEFCTKKGNLIVETLE